MSLEELDSRSRALCGKVEEAVVHGEESEARIETGSDPPHQHELTMPTCAKG